MNRKIVSLGVVAPKRIKDPASFKVLYRIADLVDGEWVPFDEDHPYYEAEYNTPTIGLDPRVAVNFRLSVCEWAPEEDRSNRQESTIRDNLVPIPVVGLTPEAEIIDQSLFDLLAEAKLSLVASPALLKLGEIENDFVVMMSTERDISALSKSDALEYMRIPASHFLEVRNQRLLDVLQRASQPTTFYRFQELPKQREKIYNLKGILMNVFSSYAKANSNRKDRQAAEAMLKAFLESEHELAKVKDALGDSQSLHAEKLAAYKQLTLDALKGSSVVEQLLTFAVENDTLLRRSVESHIEASWRERQRQQIAEETSRLEHLRQECGEEHARLQSKQAEVEASVLQLTHLEERKAAAEQQITTFEQLFAEKLQAARENAAEFLATSLLQPSMHVVGERAASIQVSDPGKRSIDPEPVTDWEALVEIVSANLTEIGVRTGYDQLVARYLASHIVSGRPLLLVGSHARSVADAISFSQCAQGAHVLSLPGRFDNPVQLVDTVSHCAGQVMLIENAVLSSDEATYLPLLKDHPHDKLLLFSLDLADHLALLPMGLLHWLGIMETDNLFSGLVEPAFIGGSVDLALCSPSAGLGDGHIKGALRQLDGLRQLFSYTYIQRKASQMLVWENPAVTWLICELIPLMSFRKQLEGLKDWFDLQQLSREDLKLIRDVWPEAEFS